jgi:diguanylate cyclase (GGDEF)-like protein/PAS domain S-box-containing protein
MTGAVFVLLLAAVVAVAVWRARDDRERHRSLERRFTVVSALEDARAEWFLGGAWIVISAVADDPAPLLELHRQATLAAREDLDRARAGLIALGGRDEVAALDELGQQMDQFARELDTLWVSSLTTDRNTKIETAQQLMPLLLPFGQTLVTGVEQLANGQQTKLAAERAAADRAADTTLTLFIAFGLVALVAGTTTTVMLMVSVVRPLASLRESVRAITSGDLAARAKVSGPEEVASLAWDFNEMISERQRAEEALRETDLRYRTLFDRSHDAIYVHDFEGRLLDANGAALRLLGYSRHDILKLSLADLLDESQLPAAIAALDEIMKTGTQATPTTYKLKRKDGAFVQVETLAAALHEGGRPVAVQGIARDVTERKQMEEALHEQARRDPLTGVLNHGAIVAELRSLISSGGDGTSHVVAMVDVDGLKATNDTYGHQVGDAVLVTVASALSRDGALVGRYGGDEFVAILPGANRQQAERYQAAVVEALASAGLTQPEMKATVPVVVSIGLATYPTEAARVEELIRLADSEMYAAKRQRPITRLGLTTTDSPHADYAAKMLGEIVPLLTSPGELNDKLELVAHRLAVGAGYEAVNFQVFSDSSQAPTGQNTFARVPGELVEAWNRERRQFEAHPLREIIERTRRPIILDDIQNDQRLTDAERELLRTAGLRSALLAPMFWQNELLGHLAVASKREAAFGPRDAQFLMAVATQATPIVRMATLVEELQSASDRLVQARTETVILLAASAEAHDHTTGLHLENVRAITEALARELDYREEDAKELGLAAVLHDIGKIRVPDSLLISTGTLADEEWELMKHHTTWGAEFLAGRPGFELAATIARSHHERWDGGGYPDGLSGDAIPEAATIVAVADAFDAITSDRPYRPRRSVAAAMQEIMAYSGKQFSPRAVQALVQLHKRKMLPYPRQHAPEERAVA